MMTYSLNASGSSNSKMSKERKNSLRTHLHGRTNTLHDMYYCQIEEMANIQKKYQWREKIGMKNTREALTRTGPEHRNDGGRGQPHQTVPKVETGVQNDHGTAQHITPGLKIQAGTAYMQHHSRVHRNCMGWSHDQNVCHNQTV